jgi:hypothetical protein
MSKFEQAYKKIVGEDLRSVARPVKQKSQFGLKVGDTVYEVGEMMDECPFEGNLDAILSSIDPDGDGYEISIIADGEGYAYTTDDIKEQGLDVEVVKFK